MQKGLVFSQMLGIILIVATGLVLTSILLQPQKLPWSSLLGTEVKCGDATCDIFRGEDSFNCPIDCGKTTENIIAIPEHMFFDASSDEAITTDIDLLNLFLSPLYYNQSGNLIEPKSDCNNCLECKNCFMIRNFSYNFKTCSDCYDCDPAYDKCTFCTNCYSPMESYDDLKYENCDTCMDCEYCNIPNFLEMTSETLINCSNCKSCENCLLYNSTGIQRQIDANFPKNQFDSVLQYSTRSNKYFMKDYSNCKYCSFCDYDKNQCFGCSNCGNSDIEFSDNVCYYCNKCEDGCETIEEPYICKQIKNAIAEHGGIAIDDIAYGLSNNVYKKVFNEKKTLSYLYSHVDLSLEELLSKCKSGPIYRKVSDGVNQFVCNFKPISISYKEPNEYATSYIDCGEELNYEKANFKKGRIYIHGNMEDYYYLTRDKSYFYDNTQGLHIKLVVGNNVSISENDDCEYNLFFCVQPTLTSNASDPIFDLYGKLISMTPSKDNGLNIFEGIEYYEPGSSSKKIWSMALYSGKNCNRDIPCFSYLFTVNLDDQDSDTGKVMETIRSGIIDWYIIYEKEDLLNKLKSLYPDSDSSGRLTKKYFEGIEKIKIDSYSFNLKEEYIDPTSIWISIDGKNLFLENYKNKIVYRPEDKNRFGYETKVRVVFAAEKIDKYLYLYPTIFVVSYSPTSADLSICSNLSNEITIKNRGGESVNDVEVKISCTSNWKGNGNGIFIKNIGTIDAMSEKIIKFSDIVSNITWRSYNTLCEGQIEFEVDPNNKIKEVSIIPKFGENDNKLRCNQVEGCYKLSAEKWIKSEDNCS